MAGALMLATIAFPILLQSRGTFTRGATLLELWYTMIGNLELYCFAMEPTSCLFKKDGACFCKFGFGVYRLWLPLLGFHRVPCRGLR